MNPISVPEAAKAGRPYCQVVSMGPPPGVSDDDCGTAEMLIAPLDTATAGIGRGQYAYFRPSAAELEILNNGGFIEFAQYGKVVQPFGAAVWPSGDAPAVRSCRVCNCTDADCSGCIERTGEPCSWIEADLCSACAGQL